MYLCLDQHSLHLAPGNCSLLLPCVSFLPLFIFYCVLPRFSACASDSKLSMESICLEEHTVPCSSSRASCISVPGLSERQQLFVGLEASQGLVTQKAELMLFLQKTRIRLPAPVLGTSHNFRESNTSGLHRNLYSCTLTDTYT